MKNLKFLAVLLVSPLFAGTYNTHTQDSDATYIQNHTTSLSDMFLINVATTNTNTSAIGNIFNVTGTKDQKIDLSLNILGNVRNFKNNIQNNQLNIDYANISYQQSLGNIFDIQKFTSITGNTLNFTNSSFAKNSKHKNINNIVLAGVGNTIENNTVNISNSTDLGNVRSLVLNVTKALSSEIGTIENNVINIESSTLQNVENINLRVNQNSKVYSKNIQGNVVNIKDDTTIKGDVNNIIFHMKQQSKFTNILNNKINIEGSNIKIGNISTIAMKNDNQDEGYNYTLSTNSNSNISGNSIYMKLGKNIETKNIFGHDVVITNHNTGLAENIKTANIYASVVNISNIKDSTFGAINANSRVNIINNNNLKFDGNIKSATNNIEISSNDITAKNISAPNGYFSFAGRNLSADSISVKNQAEFRDSSMGIGKIDIKGDLKAGSFLLQPNQDASNDAMMKVGGTLSAGSYEFVLSNVKNGDVIVEAANSKLKGKDIEVSFTNQNFSDINDKVILFKGKNDLTAGSSLGSNYKTAKGVGNVNVKSKLSAIYTDQIYGLDSDGNFILGFKNKQATTNPQIVSILTPLIANLELSNRLNDQISNELTNLNGIFYDNNISSDDIVTFANLEGFISDYDDVDLKGYSAIAGVTQRDDDLVYGAFMEYGKGQFDGSLNKTEYDGDLYSVGLGILGKIYMKDNFYIDAYAKIGQFRDEFESTYINNFKLSNTYKGFGAAVGYYKNFENLSLDSKIGYTYSYASGKSIELEGKNGSKEVVNFGSLKSNRVKFDNRFLFGSIFRPYLNANIEYEFSGENGFHTIQLPNGESMNFDGFSAGAGL